MASTSSNGRQSRRGSLNNIPSVSSSASDGGFDLVLLPDVAKQHLCEYLDPGSILNLRLTCTSLKTFVDQPLILKGIPIKIRCSKQLQKVIMSGIPFSYFVLNFQSINEQSHLSRFRNQYGRFIRKLEVKSGTDGFEKILSLIENTEHLEQLELQMFDLGILKAAQSQDTFEKIIKKFAKLKILTIHHMCGTEVSLKEEIDAFLKILGNCCSLKEFKIPLMEGYTAKLDFRRIESHPPVILLRRVELMNNDELEELQHPHPHENEDWEREEAGDPQRRLDPYPEWNNNSKKDPLLHGIIDVIRSKELKELQQINVESIPSFEPHTFRDFINFCKEKNIYLAKLDASQFNRFGCSVFSSIKPECFNLIKSAKVSYIHDQFPLSQMTNLTDLHFILVPRNDHRGLTREGRLVFPCLKSLQVQFLFDVEEPLNQLLISKIFRETERKSVEKMALTWLLNNPNSDTIEAPDLAANFTNLRELRITGWGRLTDDDCIQLWSGLQNLETLVLQDCRYITNRAFVGDYPLNDQTNISQRPFNRLKKIKNVQLRDISGKLNEVAIVESFRWIPLRSLIFHSTVIFGINLSVYEAVANSPLAKSVEHFVVPRASTRSPKLERAIRNSFLNLRQPIF